MSDFRFSLRLVSLKSKFSSFKNKFISKFKKDFLSKVIPLDLKSKSTIKFSLNKWLLRLLCTECFIALDKFRTTRFQLSESFFGSTQVWIFKYIDFSSKESTVPYVIFAILNPKILEVLPFSSNKILKLFILEKSN